MVKVKARIATDVEYLIDADIEEGRDVKRKLLERLAIEGFENSELQFIKTERVDVDDLDLDLDLSYKQSTYMYGKL